MDRQAFSGALQCIICLKTEQLPRPRRRACLKHHLILVQIFTTSTYKLCRVDIRWCCKYSRQFWVYDKFQNAVFSIVANLLSFFSPEPNPYSVMHHMTTSWQVVAKCCADTNNKSPLFPCNEIPDGTSLDAEQAFSTACK